MFFSFQIDRVAFVSVGFVFAVGCFNAMMGFRLDSVTQRLEQSYDREQQRKFLIPPSVGVLIWNNLSGWVSVLCLFFSFATTAMFSVLIHKGLLLQQHFKMTDTDSWYTCAFGNPFHSSRLGQSHLWPLSADFVSVIQHWYLKRMDQTHGEINVP